ncbi:MAG: response regulator transcription factor [Planctomycetota bacterium]|jgi:two-component system response regulator MtrA
MSDRILLVEDDMRLGRQVNESLVGAGFEVTWLRDGDEAMHHPMGGYSLVILDLMLPGAYGLDILKRLREDIDVPVLILSARNETLDKVRALELGADDYLTKPFWPEELLARVAARLRRPVLARSGVFQAGDLTLDVEGRRVEVGGKPIEFTRVEFDLLAALARRADSAVTRAWLLENVLDPDREGTERTLDVHVSRIRKKLGGASKRLATVWGVGYRLETGDLA